MLLIILIFHVSVFELFASVKNYFAALLSQARSEPKTAKKKPETAHGVAIAPSLDTDAEADKEIVFNLLDEGKDAAPEAYADPEIKVYDDVTSGPEDEEPSEEEKEALERAKTIEEEIEDLTKEADSEDDINFDL